MYQFDTQEVYLYNLCFAILGLLYLPTLVNISQAVAITMLPQLELSVCLLAHCTYQRSQCLLACGADCSTIFSSLSSQQQVPGSAKQNCIFATPPSPETPANLELQQLFAYLITQCVNCGTCLYRFWVLMFAVLISEDTDEQFY